MIPLEMSDVGSPLATPTPTSARISGKRKANEPSPNAPRRKRLALPAPDLPADGQQVVEQPAPQSAGPGQSLHHGVELLEVELVERQTLDLKELASEQERCTHLVFRTFNNGEKMLLALQLLARVSFTVEPSTHAMSLPATTEFFSAISLSGTCGSPLGRVLAASRIAHRFLENAEINPPLLRIQTMMSYITLHITLEYAIVPELEQQHPTWGSRRIGGYKYTYFYQLLNDYSGGAGGGASSSVLNTFRREIGYGKTFWSLLEELGVAAILMLAVAEPGLTVIARALGPESEQRGILTSALSSARGWWSFAHAIGPATLRTLFGPRDTQYTVPQLLHQLRKEPLPTTSLSLLNKSCERREIDIGTRPAHQEIAPPSWALEIGRSTVLVTHHPRARLARKVRKGNVWEWLASDSRSKPVFDFLRRGESADEVINFFCSFYNRRAIPRRRAVPFPPLVKLSEPGAANLTFQDRLDILADQRPSNQELFIIPAPVDSLILGLVLNPGTATATIYNWTEQKHLEVNLNEVCCLITFNCIVSRSLMA